MKQHNPFSKPDLNKPAGLFMTLAEFFVRAGLVGSMTGFIFTGFLILGTITTIACVAKICGAPIPMSINGVPVETTWGEVQFLLRSLPFTGIGVVYFFFIKPRLSEAEFRVEYGKFHKPDNDHNIPCDNMTEPSNCLSCGGNIPEKTNKCPNCGWSYTDP